MCAHLKGKQFLCAGSRCMGADTFFFRGTCLLDFPSCLEMSKTANLLVLYNTLGDIFISLAAVVAHRL